MVIAMVVCAVAGSAPRVPALSTAELERLDRGEVVLHAASDGGRVTATGVVKVDAPPDALWPAVLDVRARIPEGRTLNDVREYRRDGPRTWYLAVDMDVLGAGLRLHQRYDWDPSGEVATYTLDEAKANDLAVADGWYLVRATDGGSLLVFQSVTEAKVPVPSWVKRWLARDQMEGLLQGIRARAERGAPRG
jgi:hypothetical protein